MSMVAFSFLEKLTLQRYDPEAKDLSDFSNDEIKLIFRVNKNQQLLDPSVPVFENILVELEKRNIKPNQILH